MKQNITHLSLSDKGLHGVDLESLPKEENYVDFQNDFHQTKYKNDLQKAMESCPMFREENRNYIRSTIHVKLFPHLTIFNFKPYELYPIPAGFKVEVKSKQCKKWCGGYGCLPTFGKGDTLHIANCSGDTRTKFCLLIPEEKEKAKG